MKVTIELNIDDDLLAEIDAHVNKLGISRDEYFEQILREWLDKNRDKVESAKYNIA